MLVLEDLTLDHQNLLLWYSPNSRKKLRTPAKYSLVLYMVWGGKESAEKDVTGRAF